MDDNVTCFECDGPIEKNRQEIGFCARCAELTNVVVDGMHERMNRAIVDQFEKG